MSRSWTMDAADTWNIECSDEECDIKTGNYEPAPEEIERIYKILDEGRIPELKWKSPGYRAPTPTNTPVTPKQEEDIHTEEKTQFDFMDDLSSPKLPVRREGDSTLKGSAKKKTTSLDGVLSNMRRHRILELQMRDQTPPNTTNN